MQFWEYQGEKFAKVFLRGLFFLCFWRNVYISAQVSQTIGHYSAIFRHIQNLAYWESWNTQNSSIIAFRRMFRTLSYLRWISARRNDRRFRREITKKLIRHKTIFNFHMNISVTIIENVKSNWEFCSTFISLIEIVEHKKHKFSFILLSFVLFKGAVTDMRYFGWSKFSTSLVHK